MGDKWLNQWRRRGPCSVLRRPRRPGSRQPGQTGLCGFVAAVEAVGQDLLQGQGSGEQGEEVRIHLLPDALLADDAVDFLAVAGELEAVLAEQRFQVGQR